LGVDKTLKRIQAFFFWPGIRADIEKYVRQCDACQKRARLTQLDRVPIKAIDYCPVAFHTLNLDVIGPIVPSSGRGHNYILSLVDSFSRWVDSIPLKTLTAREACDAIISVCCKTGIPVEFRNDNASNLVSGLNEELYKRLGVTLRRSTPLHPQTNGLVERWNKILKDRLHHVLVGDKPRDWDKKLQFILWAHREIPNSTTGLSPFPLVYGRNARGPLSVLQETWRAKEVVKDKETKVGNKKYFDLLKKDLELAAGVAHKHSTVAKEVYVSNYNKKAKEKQFNVGDLVLVLIPDSSNKLLANWQGPAVVSEILSEHAYRIVLDNGSSRTLHANNLRRYVSKVQAMGVIFEGDTDFGEIECCPASKKCSESEREINQLDFSYLSPVQSGQLRSLLLKHAEVFSDKPGCCKTFEHEINLVDGFVLKRQRGYRIPEKLREEVNRQ